MDVPTPRTQSTSHFSGPTCSAPDLVTAIAPHPLDAPRAGLGRVVHPRIRANVLRLGALLLGTLAAACSWSMPSSAADGDLEINQTCATQTGCFPGDTAGFPVSINGTAGRSYLLTSDLVVPNESTDGILISADNIRVDLGGFEIRGPVVCSGSPLACTHGAGSGSGVEASVLTLSGISVRNGSIQGMGFCGLYLGAQSEVTDVRARWNRQIGIFTQTSSTLSGNKAYQNGSIGISTSFSSIVSGSTAHYNAGDGILASAASRVSGNTAYQNGGDGIAAGAGSTVSGNTSYQNGGDGISSGSGSIVSGNAARSNNAFGLFLGSQSGYRENVMSSNPGGTVSGTSLVNLGNNACNGSTVCP